MKKLPIDRDQRIPVVLIGCGRWSTARWVPELRVLAEWELIALSIVDRTTVAPGDIGAALVPGLVSYVCTEDAFHKGKTWPWQVAVVVTPAHTQVALGYDLLRVAPELRRILIEKPGGSHPGEVRRFIAAARQRGVEVVCVDHYLLRRPIQYLLRYRDCLFAMLGQIWKIEGRLLEKSSAGPEVSSVVLDLMIHLINPVQIALEDARFVPEVVDRRRMDGVPNWRQDTYAKVHGRYVLPDGRSIPCDFECGKGMLIEEKRLRISGEHGTLDLDLIESTLALLHRDGREERMQWSKRWSYGQLILEVILGA